MRRTRLHVAEELTACIRCTECLAACPALATPLPIETLNRETLDGPISPEVARFAQSCYQCGACVPVCPVGLHRDAMMLWLKVRLLDGGRSVEQRSASGGNASSRSASAWRTARWPVGEEEDDVYGDGEMRRLSSTARWNSGAPPLRSRGRR